MKLFGKKINIPETLHKPITKTTVHPIRAYNDIDAQDHVANLSIRVGFDDNSTIENKGSKVVAVLLPSAPSFDYDVEFEDFNNSIEYDGEIPFKTISFKPFLKITDILKKQLNSEKFYIADVRCRVYPSSINAKTNEILWHPDSSIEEYIRDQWQDAFNEITDSYSSQNISSDTFGYGSFNNTNLNRNGVNAKKEKQFSFLGYTFSPLQLLLSVLIIFVLFYIGMSLYGAYLKNKGAYQSINQNPYSGESIDKQVQIAEDVVAKVQDKMGVPALGENDLGCLQEVE